MTDSTLPVSSPQEIPYGYCHCGCNKKTKLITHTRTSEGLVRGQPFRFIKGHNGRNNPAQTEAANKASVRSHKENAIVNNLEKAYEVDVRTGCWIWKRSLTAKGYGKLFVNGKSVTAHKYIYELHKGSVPDGLVLDHLCRNRNCVNPDHLEPVTQKENVLRGERMRVNAGAVTTSDKEMQ
jgi:hypothetical protein